MTNSLIPPHGGYRKLKSYQMTEIIYDLTVQFCKSYMSYKAYGSYTRTYDQMVQAARSGKQNIAEGCQVSGTSKKTELKLVSVARGSLEELLQDYEDFLRQRNLRLWAKDSAKARAVRELAYRSYKSYKTYMTYMTSAETSANCLICLIHQANYLLDQQMRSLEKKFLEEGGFTERLFRKRKNYRSYSTNKSYKTYKRRIAMAVILAQFLNLSLPLFPAPVHAKAPPQITIADEGNAMFELIDRNFKVEFGDKTNETKQRVRFEAIPKVSENMPSEATPSSEVKENLKDRPFLDKAKDFVKKVFRREDRFGIEFSLIEAAVGGKSTQIKQINTDKTDLLDSSESVESVSLAEHLSEAQQQVLDNINAQIEDIAQHSASISAKLVDIEEKVHGIVTDSRQIYAKTELVNPTPGLSRDNPGVDENQTIINREVIDGVDVEYQIIDGKGVKEEIVIKQQDGFSKECFQRISALPSAEISECQLPKNTYKFLLTLDPGVQIHQSLTSTKKHHSGSFYFTDRYGRYLGHFLPPFAEDGNNQRTNDVTIEIDRSNESYMTYTTYTLIITLSLDWLLSPDRVYPIRIDPSIVHDTEAEFDTADALNRVKSISGPKVQTNYHELPVDEHTVGLWHMNNDWTDSSGNGNNGTAQGDATFTTSAKLGSHAGTFDGTGDKVETADIDTANITVEAWFKANTVPADGSIKRFVTKYDGAGSDIGFWVLDMLGDAGNERARFIVNIAGTNEIAVEADGEGSIATGEWHYIVGTYDGETVKVYLNGEYKESDTDPSGSISSSYNALITIGEDDTEGSNAEYFDGLIDEVRISNIARTPEEIKANAQRRPYGVYTSQVMDLGNNITSFDSLSWSESGVNTGDGETLYSSTDLVAQWNFNENSGTTADNAEGTAALDGTLTNFADTSAQDQVAGSGWTAQNGRWPKSDPEALMFDGSNDYVDIGDISGAGTIKTVEFWMKTEDVATNNIIDIDGTDYIQVDANGELSAVSFPGTTTYYVDSVSGEKTINAGQWHHVVVTDTTGVSGTDFDIGRVTASYYTGTMDSIRVYSRALSEVEVLSNYQAGNIEFQTRSGADNSPDDGSWEAWKPTTSETQLLAMDSDQTNWSLDSSNPSSGGLTKSDESTIKAEGSGSMEVQQGAPQVDANTVALWHFDETNGDLAGDDVFDETANNNDGEFNGSNIASNVVDSIFGKARDFNGSDDYIEITDNASLDFAAADNFSVEAWFKHGTIASAIDYLVMKSDGGGGYSLYMDASGDMCFATDDDTTWSPDDSACTSGVDYDDDNWHHVAGVKTGTTKLELFVDGASVASDATVNGSGGLENTDPLYIGVYEDGSSNEWDGTIDEVRISNTARTAEEIAEAYRMGRDHRLSRTLSSTDLSSKTKLPFYIAGDRAGTYLESTIGESNLVNYLTGDANLKALWHIDEENGSGSYIKDSSANAQHLSLSSAPAFEQGKIGKARHFDDSDDYLTIADDGTFDLNGSSMSVAFWVKTDADEADNVIISKGASWEVGINADGDVYWEQNTSQTDDASAQVKLGGWHFVVVTNNDTTATYYVDGVLTGTDTAGINTDNNTALYIGYNGTNYFDGVIDEVLVTNDLLSVDEIRQLYEIGLRTHPITIDFSSAPNAVEIKGTSEANALTDTAFVIADDDMTDDIFVGDKIIVKENYGGTEYIVQSTVSAINTGTRTITVGSNWTGTVPNPGTGVCGGSDTHCFTTEADVFKWQREWFDITSPLSSHINQITQISLRVTDGSEGRTFWIDDFKSGGAYLTDGSSSSNVTSTVQRYLQYRFVVSSTDIVVTPYISSVTVNYTTGPTNDLLMRHGKWFSSGVKQGFWWAR